MPISLGNTFTWTKSSHSANGACIEVSSRTTRSIDVRDSKVPQGPALRFAPEAWGGFVGGSSPRHPAREAARHER
ncbi:DUF397 domain-containing protein [Streptomyces sp. AJS327]|nr:DUF397 domain-containing protein [Streptomyces sp. AJS327]MBA0053302.1 DUF397 domain-containing protein [Streptomyces sp. AJS327]